MKNKRSRRKVRIDPKTASEIKSTQKAGTEAQNSDEDSVRGEDACKLVEIDSGDETCKLCGYGYQLPDDLELGPLFKFGVCQAHLHCLMFSSGLIQVSQIITIYLHRDGVNF